MKNKLFFLVWLCQILAAVYTTSMAAKIWGAYEFKLVTAIILILYFGTIILTPLYTWVVRQRILDLEYRQENLPDLIKAGVETKIGELK